MENLESLEEACELLCSSQRVSRFALPQKMSKLVKKQLENSLSKHQHYIRHIKSRNGGRDYFSVRPSSPQAAQAVTIASPLNLGRPTTSFLVVAAIAVVAEFSISRFVTSPDSSLSGAAILLLLGMCENLMTLFFDFCNGDETMSTQNGVALLFFSQIVWFLANTYGPGLLDSVVVRAISRRKWNTSPFEDDLVVLILSPNLADIERRLKPGVCPQAPPLQRRTFGCLSLSKVYSATPGALLEIQDAVDVADRGPVLNFQQANKKTMHPLSNALLEPFRAGQIMADMGVSMHEAVYVLSLVSFKGEYGDKLRAILIRQELLEQLHDMLFEIPALAGVAASNSPPVPTTATHPQNPGLEPSFDDHLWHAALSMAVQFEPSFYHKQLFPLEIAIPRQ